MALQDLNDQLHTRDFQRKEGDPSEYDPRAKSEPEPHPEFTATEAWQKPVVKERKSLASYFAFYTRLDRKQRVAVVAGSIAALLLVFGLAIKMSGMLFHEESITVAIVGPTDIPSGERAHFTVQYTNDNWEAIDEAVLVLTYPETFALEAIDGVNASRTRAEIPLGKIGAKKSAERQFSGTFSGFQGRLVALEATLQYAPPGFTARFSRSTQLAVTVTPSLFTLEISAPREAASGQAVEYIVEYRNTDDQSYPDTRLQMQYPDGFRFVSGEPRSSEGETVWYLGTLAPGASDKIIVRGILSGATNESKRMRATIGTLEDNGSFTAYNERERETRIVSSPLVIFQSVNGLATAVAKPGERLHYVVKYRNEGTIALRDAIVTVELGSPYLNYSELVFDTRGTYDEARKMLVWKASDVPALSLLEPGAEGDIKFSVPVLRNYSLGTEEKGLSIHSLAKIDSVDLPTPVGSNKIVGSNTISVKISSLVTPALQIFYNDKTYPNTGPLPPVVGRETTYTAHLKVRNTSSDVAQSRAVISLPTGIDYKDQYSPSGETVVFNGRANEIAWQMGTLAPGQERELIFQVGVTPSQNEVGQPVVLINGITFTGLDTYTGQDVQVRVEKRENYLPEDPEAATKGSAVRASE